MKERMKAVLYARYSSHLQNETTILAQRRAIKKYARKNNMDIIQEYIDRACSGNSIKGRPSMQQLLADSSSGLFEVVLVHKIDRLARKRYDGGKIIHDLEDEGIKVISVMEQFSDTPTGRFSRNITMDNSELFNENLASEVRKGFIENAYKGLHTGGIPPLGYDVEVVTRKLVVKEDEAQAVRMIFELHNKGVSLTQISEALNKAGFTTKLGNIFGKGSLHEIIRNKKYCGYYVYNRRTGAKDGKINSHKNKDKDEIVEAKGAVPAIISEEVFNKAQELMNARKIKAGAYSAKRVYLLSGKVICGHCGCNMTGNAKYNSKGTLTITYSCEHRRKDKTCPNLNIRQDKLDSLVVEKISEYIFKDENLPALVEKLRELDLKRNSEYTDTVRRLNKCLKNNTIERQRVIKAIKAGGDLEDLTEELNSLKEEYTAWQKSLDDVKAKSLNVAITEQPVAELQSKFKRYVLSHGLGNSKILINKFVDRVTENNNEIEIVLNI